MKYLKLFEDHAIDPDHEQELAAMGFGLEEILLRRFADRISGEILTEYGDSIAELSPAEANFYRFVYSPDQMGETVQQWADDNGLSIEDAVQEYDWRDLKQELDLEQFDSLRFAGFRTRPR